jgi:hypothetical protein
VQKHLETAKLIKLMHTYMSRLKNYDLQPLTSVHSLKKTIDSKERNFRLTR